MARRDGTDALLIALAFGSGAVDAISFVGLGGVFTANMTGNLVLLGLAAGRGSGSGVVRTAVSVAAFAAGVFVASRIAGPPRRTRRWPREIVIALTTGVVAQAALLAGWLARSGRPEGSLQVALVGLSAAAMGLQTGAVRALAVPGISTTYVTGTLSGLVGELAVSAGSERDRVRRGAVVGGLTAGAACGVLLVRHARCLAPVLPLAVALFVIAAAISRGRPEDRGGLDPS
ncbi:MAG: DUF1275 domain-containing protein [Actinobacteria bacterium]|nr:DUF1275 domain-containing protein [Actinomycetota bacterium]